MRIGIIAITILMPFFCKGQELHLGITGGFNAFQKIKWDRAIYHPADSYLTYIEKDFGKGLLNKNSVLSAINYGVYASARYKRFSVTIEPQFYYQKTYLLFEKPFYIERNIGKRAFRLPLYGTVNFFKGAKSPFFLLGINFIKEKNWDYHSPSFEYYFQGNEEVGTQFKTGDDHFDGMLYDNRAYFNYMLGIGKSEKRWDTSIRFQRKIRITKHSTEASIWQIEMALNFRILSSKDFTKKHFLYVDE